MDEDVNYLPCSLGLVIHTDLPTAQEILRLVHEVVGAKILYQTVSPRGEKLWIKRGGDGP